MKLLFIHDEDVLFVNEKKFRATCTVRNELNDWRNQDDPKEVVKHLPPDGSEPLPYMPRKFPTGKWKVRAPVRSNNPTFAPYKIPTSAKRNVCLWDLKSDGSYDQPSGESAVDSFYHLHYSEPSQTTLGCIRLDSKADAIEISNLVRNSIGHGEQVCLEVIASRK